MNDKVYMHNPLNNRTPNKNLFQVLDTKKEEENEVKEAKTTVKELKTIANIGIKELKKRVKSGVMEDKDLIKAVNSCIEKAQLLSGKATSISIRKTMTKEQMLLILARPTEAAKIAEISRKDRGQETIDRKDMVLKFFKNGCGNENTAEVRE